ncbi:hypothetical protein [Shewanella nanhaiensis]|uniref:Uncharacterized protein n=1 Tax=Shewanella nanhaiensis TaxID=2864872 RepID=A0ABS7E4W4_9GAMM|nr:hypothetical protein [Shewanella nanhaiensis]MBW8184062.1 hypothetical protein [Shewanella nanhaiensis]
MSNFVFLTRTINEHISSELEVSDEQDLQVLNDRIQKNIQMISEINGVYLHTRESCTNEKKQEDNWTTAVAG